MNELQKQVLVTIGVAVVMIILLFFVVQVLPMKEPVKQMTKDELKVFETAKEKCIALCTLYKDDVNINKGPCLSDLYSFKVDNWVCDVAHKPRTNVDDKNENQCKAFMDGDANKFIEITPDCKFIRNN